MASDDPHIPDGGIRRPSACPLTGGLHRIENKRHLAHQGAIGFLCDESIVEGGGVFAVPSLGSGAPDEPEEAFGPLIAEVLRDATAELLGIIARASERSEETLAAVGVVDGRVEGEPGAG